MTHYECIGRYEVYSDSSGLGYVVKHVPRELMSEDEKEGLRMGPFFLDFSKTTLTLVGARFAARRRNRVLAHYAEQARKRTLHSQWLDEQRGQIKCQ